MTIINDLYNKIIDQSRNDSKVEEIPFNALDGWFFDENSGNLYHETKKYFSVEGMIVKTNFYQVDQWMQPIINQPEIGILGLITKIVDNERYFLLQIKFEPGNINTLQFSPTVQATESNYRRTHAGKKTEFLEYFIDDKKSVILYDQLQSEQGGRFYRKRNRNIVVEIKDEIHINKDIFNWFSQGDLMNLFQIDNLVNMDLRSVLCCMAEKKTNNNTLRTNNEIINWISKLKHKYKLDTQIISLKNIQGWNKTEFEIKNEENKYFSINAVKVNTNIREINKWCQPMIKDKRLGFVGFIICNINDTLHFLIQGKCEAGSRDKILLAPTVQSSAYKEKLDCHQLLYMDIILNSPLEKVMYDVLHSQEGGRFYHIQDRHIIVKIDNHKNIDIIDNYFWFSNNQLVEFIKHGYFNVEARSLLACFNSINQR